MVPAPAYLQSSSQTQTQSSSLSHDAILKLKASNANKASSTAAATTATTTTTTQSRLSAPLKLTDAFSKRGIEHFNHTPAIGTEFEKGQLDLAELLERPDGDEEADELLRELAVMSEFELHACSSSHHIHRFLFLCMISSSHFLLPSERLPPHSPHMPPRTNACTACSFEALSGGRSSRSISQSHKDQFIDKQIDDRRGSVCMTRSIVMFCTRPPLLFGWLIVCVFESRRVRRTGSRNSEARGYSQVFLEFPKEHYSRGGIYITRYTLLLYPPFHTHLVQSCVQMSSKELQLTACLFPTFNQSHTEASFSSAINQT